MWVFGWLCDAVGDAIPNLELNHLRTISPFSQLVEPNISQDSKEPAFHVAARSQPPHRLDGANVGFLDQILCFCMVAAQDHRVTVQSVEMLDARRIRLA